MRFFVSLQKVLANRCRRLCGKAFCGSIPALSAAVQPVTKVIFEDETPTLLAIRDALVDQAVKLYARWQFDFCGQGERYRQAYEALKACLSLVSGYREEGGS